MGYDLAGLAGLARAPWRLTNAGEIVADSSALGKVLDDAPIHSDDLITVYRGMGKAQFDALSNGSGLMSNAQLAGGGAKPGFYQKYIWHSLNSSNPLSPYVSVTQSPGVARHFIIDGMPYGFRGVLKDLAIRAGWSKPLLLTARFLQRLQCDDLIFLVHFIWLKTNSSLMAERRSFSFGQWPTQNCSLGIPGESKILIIRTSC